MSPKFLILLSFVNFNDKFYIPCLPDCYDLPLEEEDQSLDIYIYIKKKKKKHAPSGYHYKDHTQFFSNTYILQSPEGAVENRINSTTMLQK